jgi:hypothetical protein
MAVEDKEGRPMELQSRTPSVTFTRRMRSLSLWSEAELQLETGAGCPLGGEEELGAALEVVPEDEVLPSNPGVASRVEAVEADEVDTVTGTRLVAIICLART